MNIFLQVVDIMRVNVDKVLERDQKISELDDRAGKVKDLKRFLILNDLTQAIWIIEYMGFNLSSTERLTIH